MKKEEERQAKPDQCPLVTIGIPTHNRASKYLRETLGSALQQTYSNLEILVSDNCSTDGTEAFVRGFQDARIRYIRHDPPIAPHANADCCLKEAKGKYFILLHDDDLLDEDFVDCCVEALAGNDAGLVHTGVRKIDGDGNLIKSRPNPHGGSTLFEYFDAILKGEAVTYFCNSLYNTEYLRAVGGFQSSCYAFQDVLANIKVTRLHSRVEVAAPKASYRIHGSKLGSTHSIYNWCEDSLAIVHLMADLMPEHADYFRKVGVRIMCEKTYAKKVRRVPMPMRFYAYFIVYSRFGFEYSPLRFFLDRVPKLLRAQRAGAIRLREIH